MLPCKYFNIIDNFIILYAITINMKWRVHNYNTLQIVTYRTISALTYFAFKF